MILLLVVAIFLILGCLLDSLSMIILAIPFFWPVFEAIATAAFAAAGTGDPSMWPAVEALAFPLGTEVADPGQYQYQYLTELKLWFGVIILIVVEVGLITPPVGLNVFIINSMAPDVPMRKTFAGVMPFFFSEMVRIAILIAFPVITLFLPRLLE
jgi:TRAP-type C4-dicarboxylate transport system permease large subunit